MTHPDPHADEALSAWMDGELGADEARFLRRRLEHDPALRQRWERWQLARACLRGQDLALVPEAVAAGVAQALAAEATPARAVNAVRHWPWLATAAAITLAVALVPRFGAEQSDHGALVETAMAPPLVVADSARQPLPADLPSVESVLAAQASHGDQSPLSESVSSVREFPLAVETGRKPWPRSPLIGREDAALQGYLVRHSELAGGDGLGGLLPLVDVATLDAEAARAPQATADREE